MDNIICARFGLFLLVFYTNIYFLDAVEVYIFNSSTFSTLGWTIYPLSPDGNTYNGWTETGASYSRTYQICQVSQQDGNYWLRTPWMPRNHANRIHVKIDFSMYSCHSIPHAELQVCKETFEIYYYESDTDTATATDPPWTSEAYTKVKRIAADGRFSDPETPAHQVINRVDEHFPVSRGGFYIALRDQGACMALLKIEVYYVVCPFVVMNFARFEKTMTASTETDLVPVHGMCVANSQVTGVQDPVYQCQGKGDWVLIQGACGCSPGYEPGDDEISCQECDFNTYKPDVGDKTCTSCPKDSHANAKGSSKCTCVQGRYRTEKEDANHDCTGPPSAPRNLRALVDNKSSVITLSWWPPENDGDRKDVSYWIDCPRCPKEVEFSPGKYGIHGLEVNVSRLESHTSYEFRVHSKNGVSEASGVDNYVSVNATTFSSVPSAVRDVTVRDKGRSRNSVELEWKEPMYPNGLITSYQIRYRTSMETVANSKYHYQSSQHGTIQRTTVVGLEAGTEYVFEVSAGTTVGYGSYSKPVVTTTRGAPSSNSYATAMIAGAVSAFFVILILVGVVIFLVFWRRRKAKQQLYFKISTLPPTSRKKELPPHENGMIYSNGANGEATVILPHISKCRTYIDPLTYEDPNQAVKEFATEIDANCIRILEVIGGGEFGDVCAALMLTPEKMTCKVAVKTLKTTSTDKDRNDFLSEASIMGQFDDPNVIKLMGVITRTRPAMIVTEFMENGSLDTFLRDNDGKLTVMQLLGMMGGIASGMRYLSEMNFVHRDLAARNILINSNMVCKVADFGLSRRKSEGAYETTGGKIPIRWTAPEAIAYKKFTSASDVWSYGVVIWEVMSYGERPYWNWPNQDVIKAVEKGYRLPPPMDCPEALHQLMLDCWQKDRNHRPTFSTIVATLDRLIRNPNALRPLAKATASPLGSSTTDINCLHDVSEWLDSIKMGRYKDDFTQAGYIRLEDIARLSQHDLPRLGVTLVGHQKKIMKSINTIRAQLETAEETLV